MVRIAIVDRNDWFREMMEDELVSYGVEAVGGARTPEGVREAILTRSPQALLWTVDLEDQRGEGVARLLAGLPAQLVPAVVALGEYQAPQGLGRVGGCIALGKRDGAPSLARAVVDAAESRERLMGILAGRETGEAALDALLAMLGFDPERAGTRYLRRGVELWIEAGEQPDRLYARIGETFSVNASCVERGMRVAVGDTWETAPIHNRILTFGGDWEKTPTNVAFMGALADVLRDAGRA